MHRSPPGGYHPGELGAAVCDALLERQQLAGREALDIAMLVGPHVGAKLDGGRAVKDVYFQHKK